jgi:hypothetical protein
MSLPRDITPWLIEDLIPVGGLVNLFGSPKAGKSFAALGMAYAIADPAQDYWLDPTFKVRKHGRVMYLQIDTPRPAWHARLDLIQQKHGWTPPPGTLYFSDASSSPYPFDIMNLGNARWLKEALLASPPDVIFIDTLREIHGSDEDSSTAMRNVIARLVDACKPAAIVLISHSRKGHRDKLGQVSNDDIMDAARGSSYVAGRMDMIARLTRCHLYTKGRSSLDGVFPIKQEEGTGLLVPNYSPGEMEMREVVKAVALVPDSNTITRLKMLRVMFPDATADQLRSKLDSAREEKALPDPKRMKYTQADVQAMLERVAKGVHPTKDEPMPMVKVGSGEGPLRRRKKGAAAEEPKPEGLDNAPEPVVE